MLNLRLLANVHIDLRRFIIYNVFEFAFWFYLGSVAHVVEKILNHISGTFSGIVAVYNQYGYDREKREALNKWAAQVIGISKQVS